MTEEQAIPCPNCGKPIFTEKFCSGCGAANPINYIDESVKVSKSRIIHRKQKRSIPVRIIIIGAVVAISLIMASFYGNSYALDNMQYRAKNVSEFDFASLTSQVELEACNPTAFPSSFDKFSAVVNYRGGEFARINVDGGQVMPYSASSFEGELKLSAMTVSGLVIALADAIRGVDSPYNENDITLKITTEATILGIAPYTHTQEFTFSEFRQFMSTQQADSYQCS